MYLNKMDGLEVEFVEWGVDRINSILLSIGLTMSKLKNRPTKLSRPKNHKSKKEMGKGKGKGKVEKLKRIVRDRL